MTFKYQTAFLTVAAIDFDCLVNFYSKLLNQEPNYYLKNIYAEFKLSGLKLGIFTPKLEDRSEFSQSVGSGLSICFEVDNLEEAISHLQEIGYPASGKINTASHGREIYTYDPAGNRLILHQSFFNI